MRTLTKKTDKGSFLSNLLTQRKYRFGAFALLLTAIVLAVVIVVNMVLGIAEDTWALSIDLSPSRVTEFDEATYDVLSDVDKDLVIHMVYQNATQTELRVQLEEMAKKYRAANGHVTFDFIDPYTEPTRLARYADTSKVSLGEGTVIVSRADDSKSRYILRSDLYNTSYVEDRTSSWGYSYQNAFNGEAKITAAIKFVNSDDTPNVYFLTGHNEVAMEYCNFFTTSLQNENYNVEPLTLGGETVPGPGDTIIVSCPQVDLSDAEYAIMTEWLDNGGRLLMSLDNAIAMDKIANFASLLEMYSLSYGEGYVVEDKNATSNWLDTPTMLSPNFNTEHEITKDMAASNRYLRIYGARPINRCELPKSGVLYDVLLSTSTGAYAKPNDSATALDDKGDAIAEGEQVLAYTALRQPDYEDRMQDTRIVLLSSPYFYADTNMITQSYNLDFAMRCMDWLVNRDVSVYVRASALLDTTLNIPDYATATAIAVMSLLIPVIVAAAGVVVWVRRRRL